ncbi:MAG TPA: fused MFS/spermidine synthase [Kiloniellales bacterium]|nr:fused MFS/spermidine synthase [Kiloniellales bacterium]
MRTATPFPLTAGLVLAVSLLMALAAAALADDGLVERVESKYNTILIYKRGPLVSLTFGYNDRIYTESTANTEDPLELPVTYTRYMTAALLYVTEPKDILEIGFGGGTTASYLHRHLPEATITSVELDDKVVELAEKYFGVKAEPGLDIVNRDGRLFMMTDGRLFDAILVDAYRGPFVPFHLMTVEFYELARLHLKPGGVLVQNVEPTTMLFPASVATLSAVFDNVEFYVAGGNVVTVAYDGPQRTEVELRVQGEALQERYGFRYAMPDLLTARRFLGEQPTEEPLTDDFAPVEALRAIERHNEKWVEP